MGLLGPWNCRVLVLTTAQFQTLAVLMHVPEEQKTLQECKAAFPYSEVAVSHWARVGIATPQQIKSQCTYHPKIFNKSVKESYWFWSQLVFMKLLNFLVDIIMRGEGPVHESNNSRHLNVGLRPSQENWPSANISCYGQVESSKRRSHQILWQAKKDLLSIVRAADGQRSRTWVKGPGV